MVPETFVNSWDSLEGFSRHCAGLCFSLCLDAHGCPVTSHHFTRKFNQMVIGIRQLLKSVSPPPFIYLIILFNLFNNLFNNFLHNSIF